MKYVRGALLGVWAIVALTGCGESENVPSSVEKPPIREGAFEGASSDIQAQVEEAATAIQEDRYADAFKTMQALGEEADLNDKQKEAIFETVAQMKKVMDYHPKIGTKEAYSAMRDLIRSLDPEYRKGGQRELPEGA